MSSQEARERTLTNVDDSYDPTEVAGRETHRNPVVHWVLVAGDRRRMVWGLSVGATLAYYGLGLAGVIGVTSGSLIASTFTSAITGVFTIVAVTISINQLVLSRVIGSPAKIRDRIESVQGFRNGVEEIDHEEGVTPTMPAGFLRVLIRILRVRVRALDRIYDDRHGSELRAEVGELRGTLESICDHVEDDLPRNDLPIFRVLTPILTNRFSRHIHTTQEIRAKTEGLGEDERRALDNVVEALEEVNITRHYFKTLYIHHELATVSRVILLTGVPAVLVSLGIILLYSADSVFLDQSVLLVVVSAGFGIVLLPLNVLFAYGLRIGTIAKMTTTFGTFTPVDEMP